MALVLDASWGSTTANTYCTIAESNVYHEKRYHTSDWLDASIITTAMKNASLVWATSLIDKLFLWDGVKISQTQSLGCPRDGAVDIEGWMVDMTTKPAWITEATAEYAYRLIQEDLLENADNRLGSTGSSDLSGFKEIKVGSITLKSSIGESQNQSSNPSRILPLSVYVIIKPYGSVYGSGQRKILR